MLNELFNGFSNFALDSIYSSSSNTIKMLEKKYRNGEISSYMYMDKLGEIQLKCVNACATAQKAGKSDLANKFRRLVDHCDRLIQRC